MNTSPEPTINQAGSSAPPPCEDLVIDSAGAVTATDCDAVPPVPVQLSVYYVVVAAITTVAVPVVGSDPIKVPPVAVHAVA